MDGPQGARGGAARAEPERRGFRILAALSLGAIGMAYGYLAVLWTSAIAGSMGAGHGEPSLGTVVALPFAAGRVIDSAADLETVQRIASLLWGVVGLTLAVPRSRAAAALHVGLAGVHYWGVLGSVSTPVQREGWALLLLVFGPYALGQLLLSPLLVFRVALLARLAASGAVSSFRGLSDAVARVVRVRRAWIAPAPLAPSESRGSLVAGSHRRFVRACRSGTRRLGLARVLLASLVLGSVAVLGAARYQVVLLGFQLVPRSLLEAARLFLGFGWPVWGLAHLILATLAWRRAAQTDVARTTRDRFHVAWDAATLAPWIAAWLILGASGAG